VSARFIMRVLVLLLAVALLVGTLLAPVARAAEGGPGASEPANAIELYVGDTHLIDVASRRVAVGNGRVLRATDVDGQQLLLLGESAGDSALQVWTRDGHLQRYVVTVREYSGEALLAQVQKLLIGTHRVEARLAGDRVVLEGLRVSAADRERVAAVAKAWPGRVFDFVDKLGWDAMIHMQVSILEVRRSASDALGIRWDSLMQGPVATINAAAGAARRGRIEWNAQLGSSIDLLRQRGDARVVAQPTLSCRSGGEAHFVAGGELPVPVLNGQGTPDVQFREYGVILDVKPTVDAEGSVYARIDTEVSDIDRSVQVMGVPGILKRHSTTEVNVRAGETIVIAGLVEQLRSHDRRGLPGLAAVPGLGALFDSRTRSDQGSELVVFITPRIVMARPDAEAGSDPGQRQLERAEQWLMPTGSKP
jgi:pilus assembly protein CpaC